MNSVAIDYLQTPGPHALEIGAGPLVKPGWLATDVEVYHVPDGVPFVSMDATQPFPLPDAAFDYVYSEHMIEHVPRDAGLAMLRECRRVLKPGGILRLVTPSLGFLLRMCSPDKTLLERSYFTWSIQQFAPESPSATNAVFLNNFVRNWGHQFIYDRETLVESLAIAGFPAVRECALGESDHPTLRGLEKAARLPPGFLELESMILEAA